MISTIDEVARLLLNSCFLSLVHRRIILNNPCKMFTEIANKTLDISRSKISRIFGKSLEEFHGDSSRLCLDDFILASHGFHFITIFWKKCPRHTLLKEYIIELFMVASQNKKNKKYGKES